MKLVKPKLSYIELKSLNDCYEKQEFRDVHIIDNIDKDIELEHLTFDGCLFEGIDFTHIHLNKVDFIDVVFDKCDLSNQVLEGQYYNRVVFKNCKLTGTSFIGSKLKDIEFKQCLGRYINFASCHIHKARFIDSDFQESSFYDASLKEVVFQQVDLTLADLSFLHHQQLDLSTSQIDGIVIDMNSLKGLVVSSFQAIDLIGILGVKVKDV